jgi:hypothetical protein
MRAGCRAPRLMPWPAPHSSPTASAASPHATDTLETVGNVAIMAHGANEPTLTIDDSDKPLCPA